MKTKTNKLKNQRKHLYKLLDSFDEKKFYSVKRFAEFLNANNGDDELMQILLKAPYDEKELSEQTKKNLA